jgi:hypothetical protein
MVGITQSHLLLPMKFLCVLVEFASCTQTSVVVDTTKGDELSEIKVTVHPKHRLICGAWKVICVGCDLKLKDIVKLSNSPTKITKLSC